MGVSSTEMCRGQLAELVVYGGGLDDCMSALGTQVGGASVSATRSNITLLPVTRVCCVLVSVPCMSAALRHTLSKTQPTIQTMQPMLPNIGPSTIPAVLPPTR